MQEVKSHEQLNQIPFHNDNNEIEEIGFSSLIIQSTKFDLSNKALIV